MIFLRGLSRWLLTLIMNSAFSTWILVAVLLATILSADTAKNWLATSGIYQKALPTVITFSTGQNTGAASKDDLQKAMVATFTPGYVQRQTETIVQATYDWIHGKTKDISFSIPVKDKRADYSANLQKELEAKFANLPACTMRIAPSESPTCIPQGYDAKKLASQYSQIPESSDFLNAPITPQSVQSFISVPNASSLPGIVALMNTAVWALPLIIVVCGALYVLASDNKLLALGAVGRRLCIHAAIWTVLGGALWIFGSGADLSSLQGAGPSQAALLTPLVQRILPDIGIVVVLYAGSALITSGVVWITTIFIRRRSTIIPDSPRMPL
ncbi:MAG TPA: hypothetical protein VFO38_01265 [Candidatus Saccharimonadales bacterium]|nr:hypothetical protein [Candidatus Saccharimonadales bacterium]